MFGIFCLPSPFGDFFIEIARQVQKKKNNNKDIGIAIGAPHHRGTPEV
jgi:hypothetical protein